MCASMHSCPHERVEEPVLRSMFVKFAPTKSQVWAIELARQGPVPGGPATASA